MNVNNNAPQHINFNLKSLIKTKENQYYEVKDISLKVPLRSFTILHVDVRSSKCNNDELKELLSHFKTSPDIIIVSETKLKANEKCQVIVEGYNFIHEGTNTNADGVGIFIKDYISYSLCNNLRIDIRDCEGIWIKLNHKYLNNCIVRAIYRHPYQIMKQFQEKLENTVEYFNYNKNTYYVAGDLVDPLLGRIGLIGTSVEKCQHTETIAD